MPASLNHIHLLTGGRYHIVCNMVRELVVLDPVIIHHLSKAIFLGMPHDRREERIADEGEPAHVELVEQPCIFLRWQLINKGSIFFAIFAPDR
jgi:hypothetical protein